MSVPKRMFNSVNAHEESCQTKFMNGEVSKCVASPASSPKSCNGMYGLYLAEGIKNYFIFCAIIMIFLCFHKRIYFTRKITPLKYHLWKDLEQIDQFDFSTIFKEGFQNVYLHHDCLKKFKKFPLIFWPFYTGYFFALFIFISFIGPGKKAHHCLSTKRFQNPFVLWPSQKKS